MPPQPITTVALYSLVFFELVVGSVLWAILRWRGWTGRETGLSWHARDPLHAIALALACYAGALALLGIAQGAGLEPPDIARVVPISDGLGLGTIMAISLVNPVYEELFVCGYLISAMARGDRHAWHITSIKGLTP